MMMMITITITITSSSPPCHPTWTPHSKYMSSPSFTEAAEMEEPNIKVTCKLWWSWGRQLCGGWWWWWYGWGWVAEMEEPNICKKMMIIDHNVMTQSRMMMMRIVMMMMMRRRMMRKQLRWRNPTSKSPAKLLWSLWGGGWWPSSWWRWWRGRWGWGGSWLRWRNPRWKRNYQDDLKSELAIGPILVHY